MSEIRSMPANEAYKNGWDRIWGKSDMSKKSLAVHKPHWYRRRTCSICHVLIGRVRVYGVKPEKPEDAHGFCQGCTDNLSSKFNNLVLSPRFA